MPDITVTITDEEMKALAYVAVDPVEWVTNLVKARAATRRMKSMKRRWLAWPTIPVLSTSSPARIWWFAMPNSKAQPNAMPNSSPTHRLYRHNLSLVNLRHSFDQRAVTSRGNL